jgi:hypothetical protein
MKELSYRIEQDEDPQSPRDWDNLGTMHCWHSRYNLGDEQHAKGTSEEFFTDLGEFNEDYSWTDEQYHFHRAAAVKRAIKENIYLPLYLYDHSGITINTTGFSCGWDSGQVGWIVVSIEDIKKEYNWKVLTKKRRKQIEKYLSGEVETYDQYLTGDVWGYIIEDENGDQSDYDSCCGFYGEEYCKEEAQAALSSEIERLKFNKVKELESKKEHEVCESGLVLI